MPHDLIGKSVRRLKGYAPSCGVDFRQVSGQPIPIAARQ